MEISRWSRLLFLVAIPLMPFVFSPKEKKERKTEKKQSVRFLTALYILIHVFTLKCLSQISALKGENVNELLETVMLVAEVGQIFNANKSALTRFL